MIDQEALPQILSQLKELTAQVEAAISGGGEGEMAPEMPEGEMVEPGAEEMPAEPMAKPMGKPRLPEDEEEGMPDIVKRMAGMR